MKLTATGKPRSARKTWCGGECAGMADTADGAHKELPCRGATGGLEDHIHLLLGAPRRAMNGPRNAPAVRSGAPTPSPIPTSGMS